VNWNATTLQFFIDNNNYFTYNKEINATNDSWPFDRPFYLIINNAIGGNWAGSKGIDDTAFPTHYTIDYVRVYKPNTNI
jgi:hypothetical protein